MHLISDHKLAFTVASASEATEIPQPQIRSAIQNGELPTARVGNKTIITRVALESWLYRLETISRAGGSACLN